MPAFFTLTDTQQYNDRSLFDFNFVRFDNITILETIDALPCSEMLAKYVQDEETRNAMSKEFLGNEDIFLCPDTASYELYQKGWIYTQNNSFKSFAM